MGQHASLTTWKSCRMVEVKSDTGVWRLGFKNVVNADVQPSVFCLTAVNHTVVREEKKGGLIIVSVRGLLIALIGPPSLFFGFPGRQLLARAKRLR